MRTKRKLESLKQGIEEPVDPKVLAYVENPGPDERAVLILASCYHYSGPNPRAAVSWDDQVRACGYFNEHGLAATLAECLRIDPDSLS